MFSFAHFDRVVPCRHFIKVYHGVCMRERISFDTFFTGIKNFHRSANKRLVDFKINNVFFNRYNRQIIFWYWLSVRGPCDDEQKDGDKENYFFHRLEMFEIYFLTYWSSSV